jgi:hypothetical protein
MGGLRIQVSHERIHIFGNDCLCLIIVIPLLIDPISQSGCIHIYIPYLGNAQT